MIVRSSRQARPAARRRRAKRLWAAALCTASFVTGQLLFGQDAAPSADAQPSLLSQYLQAKNRIVAPSEPGKAEAKKQAPAAKPAVRKIGASPVAIIEQPPTVQQPPAANNNAAASSRRANRPETGVQPIESNKSEPIAKAEAKDSAGPSSPAPNRSDLKDDNRLDPAAAPLDKAPRDQRPLIISAAPEVQLIVARPLVTTAENQAAEPKATPKVQAPVLIKTETPKVDIIVKSVPPATPPRAAEPVASVPSVANAFEKRLQTAVQPGDDNLPPIVSPSSVPRPGTKKNQAPVRVDLGNRLAPIVSVDQARSSLKATRGEPAAANPQSLPKIAPAEKMPAEPIRPPSTFAPSSVTPSGVAPSSTALPPQQPPSFAPHSAEPSHAAFSSPRAPIVTNSHATSAFPVSYPVTASAPLPPPTPAQNIAAAKPLIIQNPHFSKQLAAPQLIHKDHVLPTRDPPSAAIRVELTGPTQQSPSTDEKPRSDAQELPRADLSASKAPTEIPETPKANSPVAAQIPKSPYIHKWAENYKAAAESHEPAVAQASYVAPASDAQPQPLSVLPVLVKEEQEILPVGSPLEAVQQSSVVKPRVRR